jgi:hypothetical protein
VSTGKPKVRRISSGHGQYRQRAPVRAGLAGGLVCGAGTAGVSACSGSGGITSGRHELAGASTRGRGSRAVRASTMSATAATTCSQLSSTSKTARSVSYSVSASS